ncbi:TrbG/VirB9 family P-type conjugative transfer protein [Brevundimonas denitrificans]|uniref:TrbG/VirB9 family P-type conjugative transfer protein n=1 Tax=Brevundimonas denitrificans TaxID=1443434 RepID=UPI00223AFED5|nr:TrbG/VirB9 family P-type conjugative transfer protein [Brevundimonas denitrificans]
MRPWGAVAWEVAAEGAVLFLKPRESHGPTNLLVVTDRAGAARHYVFELTAGSGAEPLYQLRFRYPDDARAAEAAALARRTAAARDRVIDLALGAGALEGPRNLAYSVQGDPALQPSEVSDNGRFTVLRFPGAGPCRPCSRRTGSANAWSPTTCAASSWSFTGWCAACACAAATPSCASSTKPSTTARAAPPRAPPRPGSSAPGPEARHDRPGRPHGSPTRQRPPGPRPDPRGADPRTAQADRGISPVAGRFGGPRSRWITVAALAAAAPPSCSPPGTGASPRETRRRTRRRVRSCPSNRPGAPRPRPCRRTGRGSPGPRP